MTENALSDPCGCEEGTYYDDPVIDSTSTGSSGYDDCSRFPPSTEVYDCGAGGVKVWRENSSIVNSSSGYCHSYSVLYKQYCIACEEPDEVGIIPSGYTPAPDIYTSNSCSGEVVGSSAECMEFDGLIIDSLTNCCTMSECVIPGEEPLTCPATSGDMPLQITGNSGDGSSECSISAVNANAEVHSYFSPTGGDGSVTCCYYTPNSDLCPNINEVEIDGVCTSCPPDTTEIDGVCSCNVGFELVAGECIEQDCPDGEFFNVILNSCDSHDCPIGEIPSETYLDDATCTTDSDDNTTNPDDNTTDPIPDSDDNITDPLICQDGTFELNGVCVADPIPDPDDNTTDSDGCLDGFTYNAVTGFCELPSGSGDDNITDPSSGGSSGGGSSDNDGDSDGDSDGGEDENALLEELFSKARDSINNIIVADVLVIAPASASPIEYTYDGKTYTMFDPASIPQSVWDVLCLVFKWIAIIMGLLLVFKTV